MKLYLAGRMSNMPDYNHPAFSAAAEQLREAGYKVVNPADNGLPPAAPWRDHMRRDLAALKTCDAVALLPGWEQSRGARIERWLANRWGMTCRSVRGWCDLERVAIAEDLARIEGRYEVKWAENQAIVAQLKEAHATELRMMFVLAFALGFTLGVWLAAWL